MGPAVVGDPVAGGRSVRFVGWMYDIAREQSPQEHVLQDWLEHSRAAGYNAVGFYLEHRFAYESVPWAAAPGCLTADVVRRLSERFRPRGLRIIPFLNTLGHMEGFIRSQGGQWLAEGPAGFGGVQMCATRPECATLAHGLVEDALAAFDDEWVHLGGDETRQLGQCPACAARVADVGQGGLYGEYFGPLCRFVLERGRRPCLWGDMLLAHPAALAAIPRATVIFDWQYTSRPRASTRLFREHGFDVVCCPSLQTYNSGWCFLGPSQQNIDEHAADADASGALGVLVTTWEFSFFSQYASVLPLIWAAGRRLAQGADWPTAIAAEGGSAYAQAAEILGHRIPAASAFLRADTWRQLRDRFVIRQSPFSLWQAWRVEACGPVGDEILRLCEQAAAQLPADAPLRFAVELHRVAVTWVRAVERASQEYADGHLGACGEALQTAHALLARLRPGLRSAAELGGSAADLSRLDRLQEKMERAINRVRDTPAARAWRPAFESVLHDGYASGDQAAWCTAAWT